MDYRPRLGYLAPLIRWWWVVLLTAIAAAGAVLYTLNTLPPSYRTAVKLQIVAPGPQAVALFGQTRTQISRDEILFVENNFIEIIKSDSIAQRVVQELGLRIPSSDITQSLTVSTVPNTDVVYVYLNWTDPEIAPRILAAQVRLAQESFAKARAKPASSSRQFISQQLVLSRKELDQAKNAFGRFQIDHRMASMEQEIGSLQDIITTLRLERDKALARGETLMASALDSSLAERSRQMGGLIATSPEYNNLEAAVNRAEATYNFLLEKENEALLKENESLNVDFIQLLEEPRSPATLVPVQTREMAVLGVLAGLLLGGLLALALGPKRLNSRDETVVEGIKKGALGLHINKSGVIEVHLKNPAP